MGVQYDDPVNMYVAGFDEQKPPYFLFSRDKGIYTHTPFFFLDIKYTDFFFPEALSDINLY